MTARREVYRIATGSLHTQRLIAVLRVNRSRQTKINNLNQVAFRVFANQKNVFGFQVAMNNPLIVDSLKTSRNL